MPTPSALPDYFNELKQRIGGDLRTDAYSRILYSTDASSYQVMPLGVLIPHTLDDVHAAVELANKYRIPILARGAGTSLAGQTVNEAVIIDLSQQFDRILEVNAEEHWARVQPGVVLDVFNANLAKYGLQFGPDPASSNRATLGGISSNNSTGAHSILYGVTTDHVLEMDVFLSDGTFTHLAPLSPEQLTQHKQKPGLEGHIYRSVDEIAHRGVETILAGTPRHWRRCGGYNLDRFVEGANFNWPRDPRFNLSKLVSGSEGTLAVITELKLNLVPRPKMTGLAIVHFDDTHAALSSVPILLEVNPSAIEMQDKMGLTLCREVPAYARLLSSFVVGTPACILIVEFYGESEAELEAKVAGLKDHIRKRAIPATAIVPAVRQELQNNVWAVRKVALGLLMSIKGDYKPVPFIEDAAVPVQHLADYVGRIERFCNELGTDVAYYAHASAGCLHVRPIMNIKLASEREKLKKIMPYMAQILTDYGGAVSSEHGDGRSRGWLNEQFFGPDLMGLYREVKRAFDPHNLLNPDNVVNSPPVDMNLRYQDAFKPIQLHEHLDFSSDQGFMRAVEMCNGAGICRKPGGGTMCPSFMVTREEEHTTRGRANALRAAMTGRMPAEELTSPRMFEVMDLCVECKACKAECPSSVDMAKIKFEFLAHYYEKHPVPLRSKMFADIARTSRLASGPLAPLANAVMGNALIRKGLEKVVGISSQRKLPEFAREPFTQWFSRRQKAGARSPTSSISRPPSPVILFNDTFNTYNTPEIAIAATEVLEAAGYDVTLPGHHCCGRPMISKGLVDMARNAAQETVEKLYPYAEKGIPIIGLEPSCLLTLRDEYLYLLPGDPRPAKIAEHAVMFEEFVAKQLEIGDWRLEIEATPGNILLHGHCHQKSLIGTGSSKQVLTLTGATVAEVDSGCCGMAGSFGYETEHYEVSLKMGERRLLPAVREVDGLVVAAGASCRAQIAHGTGKRALHPAEVLRRAMKDMG
ncbi:MAG: FAD-binding and (Fe-S)-binding domain-containing protein [Anaerolineales bacterium]